MRKRATSLRVTLAISNGFPSINSVTLLALPTAKERGGVPENSRVPGCAFSEKMTSPLLRTSVHDLPLKVIETRRSPSNGAVAGATGAVFAAVDVSGLATGGETIPLAVVDPVAAVAFALPAAAASGVPLCGAFTAVGGAMTLPEEVDPLAGVAPAA